MHNTTGYGSVISNSNMRSKSHHADWNGTGKGNQTMLHIGNQSLQNIMMTNNNEQSNYASTAGGLKVDSFYVEQVEKYNVKYNPKAQTQQTNAINLNY